MRALILSLFLSACIAKPTPAPSPTATPTPTPTPTPTQTSALPAPNHPIDLAYYYSDGRYGDFNREVFPWVSQYIPSGWVSEATWGNPDPMLDLRVLYRIALSSAYAAGKSIQLGMSNESEWDELLFVARGVWPAVKYIEIAHEQDRGVTETEAMIARLKAKIAAAGLSMTPKMGVLEGGSSEQAPSVEWVGLEAYLPPPGPATPQETTAALNALLDQKIARVVSQKTIILIAQSYDRNGQWPNIETLKAMQAPVYLKAHNNPRVAAIWFFSYARPGGSKDHAELIEIHRAMWSAMQ